MTAKCRNPTQSQLQEMFDYDPITGVFMWRGKTRRGKSYANKKAGSTSSDGHGQIYITSFGRIMAHRLAWIYVHGKIPDGMLVDHIDGNPRNNAIANLRLATIQQNNWNRRVNKSSGSGLKGAFYRAQDKKWHSGIRLNGRRVHLGSFDTAQEAHEAYRSAADMHFGKFART
jgi:hypothetical protein